MAFVCTLNAGGLPAVVTDPNLTSLMYPIGYDDEDRRTYQLFISFDMAPGGIVEYSFCIVATLQDGSSHDFWDSQVIAAMISRKDRVTILTVLLDATLSLVQATRYPAVTMHTFGRELPPKALVKYRYIEQIFKDEGYAVRTEEHRGQHVWWFERNPISD